MISLVVEALHRLLFGASVGLFNPLDPQVGRLIAAYLFVQPFYFLGAAWFRKSHSCLWVESLSASSLWPR